MLLELYVMISLEGVPAITGASQQNRHIKFDRIYEQANEARLFFDRI